jgi:hypothetical protein
MIRSRIKPFFPLGFLSVFVTLLLAGCGGGGGDNGSTGGSGTYVAAPQTLTGGTLLLNYNDGRSYTLYFDNTTDTGIRRSDGKTSTAWTVSGLGGATLTLNISYGTVATGDDAANNVYDSYAMAFSSKTAGDFSLRENTTINSGSAAVINGKFTFTVYPPNG